MLEFRWTRHMIGTILVLSFDLCVHFFMVFLCLSHKQKLQEHFPLFIGLLILFEITYKLTIYEYLPLKRQGLVFSFSLFSLTFFLANSFFLSLSSSIFSLSSSLHFWRSSRFLHPLFIFSKYGIVLQSRFADFFAFSPFFRRAPLKVRSSVRPIRPSFLFSFRVNTSALFAQSIGRCSQITCEKNR